MGNNVNTTKLKMSNRAYRLIMIPLIILEIVIIINKVLKLWIMAIILWQELINIIFQKQIKILI